MANKIVLADTSILIDLFRKSDKENSRFVKLALEGYEFQISAITDTEFIQVRMHHNYHFGMIFCKK